MIIEYPKTLEENLRLRAELLNKAESDTELQLALKEACRRDRLLLFNLFYWTYDPRPAVKTIPFITYKYQDATILWDQQCAIDGEDNFMDKTRDMGATWMLIGNDFADWLFMLQRIEIRWGSRKEQYVDTRGDMDCHFEKFRFLLRHLPLWMYPKGFKWSEHDNTMRLINPETGSSITGESTNPEFGRGGRKYRVRFDEFAYWDNAKEAYDGTADVTNCRTVVSTPSGSANMFAQLAKNKEIRIKRTTLHWTLHPHKSHKAYYFSGTQRIPVESGKANTLAGHGIKVRSPWYDAECLRRDEKSIAQELDISYLKSGSPFFDLEALSRQKEWEYFRRFNAEQSIPHGKYIKVNLVMVMGKMRVRECNEGRINIFELPQVKSQYVIGGDTAEGLVKGDQCFACVRDKWTRNVVATLHLNYSPEEFAEDLFLVEKYYNEARNAPENNNHGYSVCKELHTKGSNLYMSAMGESNKGQKRRGFTTTSRSRPLMLDRAREEIRKNSYEMRDPVLISQHETFVHNEKNGRPEADGDFKDDGVIANSICGFIIDIEPYKGRAENDHRRAEIHDEKKRKSNAGFGFAAK